jgi:hypothetical protein
VQIRACEIWNRPRRLFAHELNTRASPYQRCDDEGDPDAGSEDDAVTGLCRSEPDPIARFHDERDLFHGPYVGERILVDGDQVGRLAGRNRTYLILQVQH